AALPGRECPAVGGKRGLRRALVHDAEVGVEIDARPRHTSVANAEIRRRALAGLHRAADAAAVYLIGIHVELVVVEDETAADTEERPERGEIKEGVEVRELQ